MDCEKVVMYSGNEHDGQYWAQNNVYSLKHIVPTLLQWWKFHRNNVNEGDTITSTEFAENVSKGTDFLPPASVRHFLDTSLDLGLLKRDNSNYVITAKGIRFMEMNFPQRWIDEKWQGDIQNLINDANGGCFSSVKNEPLLEWTEDQKDFLCSELLDACFDADTKFLIFKEIRFIRFNGGRWMPAPGNASSSVWSNDHLRKGLFRLFFRKIFNDRNVVMSDSSLNNTVQQVGVWCEELGLIRTLNTKTGPGTDVEITEKGEELYTKLEKQYEEARAMPFEVRNDYKIKQTNAGGRFWLEGGNRDWWDNSGFPKDTPIRVEYGDGIMTIQPCAEQDKDHIISTDRKLVDIKNHDVDKALRTNNNDTIVKYTVYPFKIVVETI